MKAIDYFEQSLGRLGHEMLSEEPQLQLNEWCLDNIRAALRLLSEEASLGCWERSIGGGWLVYCHATDPFELTIGKKATICELLIDMVESHHGYLDAPDIETGLVEIEATIASIRAMYRNAGS